MFSRVPAHLPRIDNAEEDSDVTVGVLRSHLSPARPLMRSGGRESRPFAAKEEIITDSETVFLNQEFEKFQRHESVFDELDGETEWDDEAMADKAAGNANVSLAANSETHTDSLSEAETDSLTEAETPLVSEAETPLVSEIVGKSENQPQGSRFKAGALHPSMLIAVMLLVAVLAHALFLSARGYIDLFPSSSTAYPLESLNDIANRFRVVDNRIDALVSAGSTLNRKLSTTTATLEKHLDKQLNSHLAKSATRLRALIQTEDIAPLEQRLRNIIQEVAVSAPVAVPVLNTSEGFTLVPEFQRYLDQAISDRLEGHTPAGSWEGFVAQNNASMIRYLRDVGGAQLGYITRETLERTLHEKLVGHNGQLKRDIGALLGEYAVKSEGQLAAKVEKLVNKRGARLERSDGTGLASRNFASFADGARILGFLTSPSIFKPQRTILGKALLGWYDFLVTDPQSEANSVLADPPGLWVTALEGARLGVKLTENIYLTELAMVNPNVSGHTFRKSLPRRVGVYVRALNASETPRLREVFLEYAQHQLRPLASFVKIMTVEWKLNQPGVYQRFKTPERYLLAGIAVKDVYLEFESNWGNDSVLSVGGLRVFGVTSMELVGDSAKFGLVNRAARGLQAYMEQAPQSAGDAGALGDVLGNDEAF